MTLRTLHYLTYVESNSVGPREQFLQWYVDAFSTLVQSMKVLQG